VILNNPKAHPHELCTGSALPSTSGLPGPGQSVALIAPQFNNLGHIGYRRRQVIAQNPHLISSYTGTDRFISDYAQFRQQCPGFVQHFQLDDDVQILSVQPPFIQCLFSQSEETTSESLPSIFRYGMISDGAHKFFSGATLNHTCVYFDVLHRWQPILASWMGRQNAETYTIHFLTLFSTIASQICSADPDIQLSSFHEIISTVVDFSDAQRSGFEGAYVRFMTDTDYGHRFQMREWALDPQYQFPSHEEHHSVARGLLRGCRQHWRESVTRISNNHHIIPPDRKSEFHNLINQLYSSFCVEEFEETMELIENAFPNTADWLRWWARTEHSHLLFPGLREPSDAWGELPGILKICDLTNQNI